MGKTKVMRCRVDTGKVVKSGKYPCGVCGKGVGANSIQCTSCKAWIHKRCSGIKGILTQVHQYRCVKCKSGVDPAGVPVMPRQKSLGNGQDLECVEEFCYLGGHDLSRRRGWRGG